MNLRKDSALPTPNVSGSQKKTCRTVNRGLFIFRCASSAEYFAAHARHAGPVTYELIEFMRACGSCSSWAWHAESSYAREIALLLIQLSAGEAIGSHRPASHRPAKQLPLIQRVEAA